MKQDLITQYYTVIDPTTGKIKNCGRDACFKLLDLLIQYTEAMHANYPDTYFGNEKNGFLEVDHIVDFMKFII